MPILLDWAHVGKLTGMQGHWRPESGVKTDMKMPATVDQLTELGRERLSKNFYMREFLYSEISQIHGIPNIPEKPDLALAAGRQLCENVLEPIQERLGRIAIRSAYRSPAVNAKGAENGNQYRCAKGNEADHVWDSPLRGYLGATACIVVTSFVPYYERTKDWTALAWWIHDNVPAYADMFFFPKLCAFNIRWFADPGHKKSISSYIKNPHTGDKKALVKNGEAAIPGPYARFYRDYVGTLRA